MLRVLICVITPVAFFMFIWRKKQNKNVSLLILEQTSCIHKRGFAFLCATSFISLLLLCLITCDTERLRGISLPSPTSPHLSLFVPVSCPADGISQLPRIIIHNSGVGLWQSINRNRYPYFLRHYLIIAESARSCYPLLLGTTDAVSIFSLSFTLPPPLSVSNVLVLPLSPLSLIASIRVSSFQLKSISTDIPSVSSLLLFHPVLQ